MYFRVYLNFSAYNANLLKKFDKVLSNKEKSQILQTMKEFKTFFFYIQQMIIIQVLYLMSQFIKGVYKPLWMDTFYDIVTIILMISNILMYIGYSQSISRAFRA